jgi:hypothetical protein
MADKDTPNAIQRRLQQSALEIEAGNPRRLLFQHTVLCQTAIPYRNPGTGCRVWERVNGNARLRIEAGAALHPETGEWVNLGLPFGPKPRLIVAHLNAEALRTGNPVVEVDATLSSFVQRLGLDPKGRNLASIKTQLGCLSAAQIRFAVTYEGRASQVQTHVVSGFDLWFPRDERQRVLWPTTIRLSLDYFENLQHHAVPLDERALAALSHSAMALDLYAWLAQRLHRVDPGRPQFVAWQVIRDQFGHGYARMVEFRRVFLRTLEVVCSQYRAACLTMDEHGLTLHHSQPPIRGRLGIVLKP